MRLYFEEKQNCNEILKKRHLETPGLYLPAQGHLLVLRLGQVDGVEGAEDLANDIVPGVPVEAQDDEVQGDRGQLVEVDTVEGEVLVVDGIAGLAEHAGLDLVLLVGQQLQLDVGVGRAEVRVLAGQVATPDHRDDQRVLVVLVAGMEGKTIN